MSAPQLQRLLALPATSFFLFGPRGVGKSTWLRSMLPSAKYFDLLDTRTLLELTRAPHTLEARIGNLPRRSWVCIDEVQRLPDLLNEVHRLIEARQWRFALSGSSARKLRRGGANLLGGRALTRTMEPLVMAELGTQASLDALVDWGGLPLVALARERAADTLSAYVHTYLREEIREEGLIRKIEPFVRFLQVAGMLNGQQVNGANVSREAGVSRSNVDGYFSILEDTLVGHRLPAYQPRLKVREQQHPKFYWFDSGVARAAAGLEYEPVDADWRGRALETHLFHELRTWNEVSGRHRPLYFYRTQSGQEIDFVIELRKATASRKARVLCLEVKHATRWDSKWNRAMREWAQSDSVTVEAAYGVYRGVDELHHDGVRCLPVTAFLERLYAGKVY